MRQRYSSVIYIKAANESEVLMDIDHFEDILYNVKFTYEKNEVPVGGTPDNIQYDEFYVGEVTPGQEFTIVLDYEGVDVGDVHQYIEDVVFSQVMFPVDETEIPHAPWVVKYVECAPGVVAVTYDWVRDSYRVSYRKEECRFCETMSFRDNRVFYSDGGAYPCLNWVCPACMAELEAARCEPLEELLDRVEHFNHPVAKKTVYARLAGKEALK